MPEPQPALEEVLNEIADLRPLNTVATSILQITEGDRFSAHELARMIASDQALTVKMLRLANSAYYGFPRKITTVRDAVVLLGFRAVRSTTLASCVIDALEGTNLIDYREFWHFSVTVGMLPEVLANTDRAHRDEAFTAGVIHNIGRLALDQHRPDLLRRAVTHAERNDVTLHEAQAEVIGFTDAQLGGALALHWNFPQPLIDAVAGHVMQVDALPDPQSVCAQVVRARLFARSYGLPDGVEHGSRQEPPQEWTVPPISTVLHRAGGLEGVLRRVDAFLETALSG